MMTSVKLNPAELPLEVFDHIMFLLSSLYNSLNYTSLMNCRLVCKDWNKKIMRSLWDHKNKKWSAIIGKRFKQSWKIKLPTEKTICKAEELITQEILPSDVLEILAEKLSRSLNESFQCQCLQVEEIKCAAILAHKGLMVPVEDIRLCGDLTSVPHIASLVSCVKGRVSIKNIRGCDLKTILDSVKCQGLSIYQNLGRKETEALVRAMETRVKMLGLTNVILHKEAFIKYSGRGRCDTVGLRDAKRTATYREELRSWASNKAWEVIRDTARFEMKRN